MTKKFDVVIGNPPYQKEAGGSGTRDTPVYNKFMDAAYDVGRKVVLITPARFLFNAGFTPKAWNEKMLSDPHLTVPIYEPHSSALFPGTDIKGGIVVTYRDENRAGNPIETFTKFPELNDVLHRVVSISSTSISTSVSSGRAYFYTTRMHDENPSASTVMSSDAQFRVSTNAFKDLDFLFYADRPADVHDYVQVLGVINNRRMTRWIRSDYLTGPESFRSYKVAIPAANGSGHFGEVLSTPRVLGPHTAVTQTFITVGSFADRTNADACLAYLKTKFARALLGVLKITQHNPARVWKYVPAQDFSSASDIDWSRPISEIDRQLYAKYGLSDDEITFIETHVEAMT